MARERFSFNDTKEYNKDDLQPNNDLHAGQTGKFTFDDEIEEKPKKVKKLKKTKQPKNGKKLKLKNGIFYYSTCCFNCCFPTLYFCFLW